MKKKMMATMLSAVMALSMVPMSAFTTSAATLDENWENCTACSAENPHIITTKAELNNIREHVKTEGGIGGYFQLGNDIVFEASDFAEGGDYYRNGAGWLPIGHNDVGGAYGSNNGIYFDGSFDGNGFAVSGLYTFYESNWRKYNGLFAMLGSSAHIFDLTLRDFDMQADVSGALAGMVNSDNVLIENITVDNCNMKHWNDTGNASGLLVGKLQGTSTVQNIVIKNSTYDSNNEARQGWIAGLIQGTKIKNVEITNCTLENIGAGGLLAETIRNGAELDNITINDSTYVHTYWDNKSFIANTVSDDVKLSNITMDLKVTGKKTDKYDNSVTRIEEDQTLFGTENVLPQMTNVNLNIAFDMTDYEKGTVENGSLKMRVENNVIYAIEATNQLNKIKSNGAESIAYTDGGTFADGTVFENDTLATPEKEKYSFEGWYEDSEFTTEHVGVPEAGKAYYAKWEALPVAQVGDAGYYTLQEAIDNAQAGQEIKLAFDIAETGITVAADDDVVINLNGKTVTGDFIVYGKATIQNGTIINTNVVSGIESNGESADLTVENLTVTSNRHALRIDGGKAHIVSGTYTSTADGISAYAVNVGGDIATELTIDDGVFTSSEKASTQGTVLMLKNELVTTTINDGTFNSADIYSFENYGTMTINGGTFKAGFVASGNTVIHDGKFEKDPSAYLVDEKESVLVNGTYVIQEKRAFAVTADENAVAAGEEVKVTVTLNGTDLVGAKWTLVYDQTKFKLVEGEVKGEAYAGTRGTFNASEVLATYTFKAIVQQPDGIAATFTVENVDAWNIGEANKGDKIMDADIIPVEVTVIAPVYEVSVKLGEDTDYVAGKKLVMIYTNIDTISFTYAGATMYDTSAKYAKEGYTKSFAIVIDAITEGTVADYEANVAIEYSKVGEEYVLSGEPTYDLNNSGEFNLRDVTAAYGVYNGEESTFAEYMNIVLNADVDHDGDVDADDAAAFVEAYNATK